MNTILFSIIMPSYNQGQFIEKAIISVLSQTYDNWELIIVDNNSNDNTLDIVNNFSDPRISLFTVNNNGIISISRNVGLEKSNGSWITFLDTDDFWYNNRLDVVLKVINSNTNLDIISNDEYVNNYITGFKKLQKYGPNESDLYQKMLLYGNVFSTSSIAIKKELFDKTKCKFDESREFITAEDYDLWLSLISYNPHIHFSKIVTGEYIIHNNNNSRNFSKHISAINAVLVKHITHVQNFEIDNNKLIRKIEIRLNITFAIYKFKIGNYFYAIHLIIKTFFSNPVHFLKILFYLFKKYI